MATYMTINVGTLTAPAPWVAVKNLTEGGKMLSIEASIRQVKIPGDCAGWVYSSCHIDLVNGDQREYLMLALLNRIFYLDPSNMYGTKRHIFSGVGGNDLGNTMMLMNYLDKVIQRKYTKPFVKCESRASMRNHYNDRACNVRVYSRTNCYYQHYKRESWKHDAGIFLRYIPKTYLHDMYYAIGTEYNAGVPRSLKDG